MQKPLISLTGILLLSAIMPAEACETFVNGYYRRDGTYVQPHYRTCRNKTVNDNWSTRDNVNPYTGREGYRPRNRFQSDYGVRLTEIYSSGRRSAYRYR